MSSESRETTSNEETGDLGLETVALLRETLQIDDEWCHEQELGFRWWPAEQAQEIWCEPAFDDDGLTVWRLHIRTDLFRSFEGTAEQLDWLQGCQAGAGALSGPVREGPQGDRVRLAASAWVHDENLEWAHWLLAWEGVLQATEARGWAAVAAEEGIATVDSSAHPTSGARTVPDDMLQGVQKLVMPAGELESPWVGSEMEVALEVVRQLPSVLATGGPTGLTAEFPLLGETSLLQLFPAAQHPALGTGLLAVLKVPVPELAMSDVLALNERELHELTRAPFLGSWLPDEYGVSWASFYPNVMWRPGAAVNVASAAAARARWIAEAVYGDDWSESFEVARKAVFERAQALAEALRGDE